VVRHRLDHLAELGPHRRRHRLDAVAVHLFQAPEHPVRGLQHALEGVPPPVLPAKRGLLLFDSAARLVDHCPATFPSLPAPASSQRGDLTDFLARLEHLFTPIDAWGEFRRGARPAAVTFILYDAEGHWRVPFVRRRADLPDHPGQVALPGGGVRPGESAWEAAQREVAEEIGVPVGRLRPLGAGRPIYAAMGGRGGSLEAALAYSNVVFAGNVLVWLMNALASVIRGTGNMLVPSLAVCIGIALLVPLSPLFIFGY